MAYPEMNYATVAAQDAMPPSAPRTAPQSPQALEELASVAQSLARVADGYINARHDLNDAVERYNRALNAVAKHRESEGI